jgi:hypothetical protein
LTNLSNWRILGTVARPEYPIQLTINGKRISRIVIDQHYKEKHADLNDELILRLVTQLDQLTIPIEMTRGEFDYFSVEPVFLDEKRYRLILVMCISDDYLGVVNAFRVRRKKND